MDLTKYIAQTILNLRKFPEIQSVEFDIGVTPNPSGGAIIVQNDSTNRIKFTLQVKKP